MLFPATDSDHFPSAGAVEAAGRKQPRVLFVTGFYVEEALAGVVDYAREAGWELIANMRFHGIFPSETEADGIIATSYGPRVREWLAGWNGCPTVQMIIADAALEAPAVVPDYPSAARIGVRHLLELGHRHCAFYWLQGLASTVRARQIFESELAAAGRQTHLLDFPAAYPGQDVLAVPRAERFRWLLGKLQRLPKPLAVMADDDRRALELLAACDLGGLRVPEDVAILGCDNRALDLGLARIPLSSVDMNLRGVGWEAAALLGRLMRGEPPPAAGTVLEVPPGGVVARRSTAAFITESPAITAAVLHLREHFHRPIRLAQLAAKARMSERVFETEFKRGVGRTVRDELRRVRLACAERLLRDTDLKLEAIATESGFGSAKRLCEVFNEDRAISPNVWRCQVRRVIA